MMISVISSAHPCRGRAASLPLLEAGGAYLLRPLALAYAARWRERKGDLAVAPVLLMDGRAEGAGRLAHVAPEVAAEVGGIAETQIPCYLVYRCVRVR